MQSKQQRARAGRAGREAAAAAGGEPRRPGGIGSGGGVGLGGVPRVLGVLGLLWAVLAGCEARSGMFCEDQSDCRVGLMCSMARMLPDAGPSGSPRFGVCVPARRGAGEVCLSSGECEIQLRCSNEIGQLTSDGQHGTCIARPADAGASDLGSN